MKAWELREILDGLPSNTEVLVQSGPLAEGQIQITDKVKNFRVLAQGKPALLLTPGEGDWREGHSSPASHSSQSSSPSEGAPPCTA